jgi:hypothetical protein
VGWSRKIEELPAEGCWRLLGTVIGERITGRRLHA